MREDSGVAPGLMSLPSGGGAAPLGDRFEPDLVRGSGSYSVPIACPKGPNELRPALSLSYSSGSGNGPFGLGWQLNVPRIERATDRGLPHYTDDDTFSIGGADTLVAVGGGRYRPASDSQFWLIERDGDAWRVKMGDGRVLMFGQTPDTRESDGSRIFAWCLDQETDPAGNSIGYRYLRDGGRLYVDEIEYSIFSLKLSYQPRADILRNGRAGWLRSTALRLQSMALSCSRVTPPLMRTYTLTYDAAPLNGASLLNQIALSGMRDGETAAFPELHFGYSAADFTAWQVDELQAMLPPPGLDDASTQLVDMTGDALPDVLVSAGQRTLLWRNRGDGWLDGPAALDGIPSTLSLDRPNVALADLAGNGRADLFAADQPLSVVFETNGHGGFAAEPVVFRDQPTLRLAAPDTRLMDVDGDGVTDLIWTGPDAFLLFRHQPGAGWQQPQAVSRVPDLEQFPDISLADRGVLLADMTGDGLQDFVSVQSGNLAYWPYLGHGVWGARVEMEDSPQFPDGYRNERVQVVDLDGDGCSDIVYLDFDRTLIWINQAGVGWGDPIEIPVTPPAGSTRVIAADFYGDGRPGFGWSASPGREDGTGYRVLRFDPGHPAYLLTTVENGMGGRSSITYASTTVMRLADRAAGRDWPGQLPLVVQVVAKITEADEVTGRAEERSFRYHDGVFDGVRREFRGFSSVTVDSDGDASVPASRQEFDYFQGDPEATDLLDRDRQRALAGALTATRLYELTGGSYVLRQESAQLWDTRVEYSGAGTSVVFPFLTSIETRELSGQPGVAARIERSLYADYDETGNLGSRSRESLADGDPPDQWIRSQETYQYTRNTAGWIVRLPVRLELRDGAGVPFAVHVTYYDGSPLAGLAEGQADHGLPTRVQELRLLDTALPASYTAGRDLTSLGFEHQGAGDTSGYYATTMSVRRDITGNVVEQQDPLGSSLLFTFDDDGVYPVSATDALGQTVSLTFDPRAGEPEKVTFTDGRTVRYEHDAVGRLTASFETDDSGAEQLVKRWVLDLTSQPVCVTSVSPAVGGHDPGEFTTASDFGSLDAVVVSRVYYDGMGAPALQVSTAPDAAGGGRRFMTASRDSLNARALTVVQFAPQFVSTLDYAPFPVADTSAARMRYDVTGSRQETLGPGPAHHRVVRDNFTITHYEGDAAGPFGAPVPPGPASRVERFDARDRLCGIQQANGDGTFITTSYDLALDGQIEVVRDGSGAEVTRYTFGGPQQVIGIENRDAGTRVYYRDAAGRLREQVNADGSRVFQTYDALGRMTLIEAAGPGTDDRQTVRQITYDADPDQPSAGRFLAGRPVVVTEPDYTIRYSYNRAGKVVREDITTDGITLVTSHEYDLQGRLTALIYPDGRRVTYTLDRSGAPAEIPGVLSGVSYDADGAMSGYALPSGIAISSPRDPLSGRLVEVAARKDGATLRRIGYGYDAIGNILTVQDETPADTQFQTFGYDGLHRLTSYRIQQDDASGAVLRAGVYAYDAPGNLLRLDEAQALTLDYGDPAHPGRLTSVGPAGGSQAVTYDARGHTQSLGDLTLIEYDQLDRLVHAVKADGTDLRMSYDPQNRRIFKRVQQAGATSTVRYAARLFEQHDASVVRHIFLGGTLVASETVAADAPGAPRTAFYLSDRHGTIVLATDDAGSVIQAQRYTPFGLALAAGGALDLYLGRVGDSETGLLHLGARYYAPWLARFISPDWYVLENPSQPGRLPQAFNLYSYAINNPLIFKDPSGMWFFLVLAAAFVAGFVVGTIYGLAKGQGWGSLLTGLETGLLVAGGFALGAGTGYALGAGLGFAGLAAPSALTLEGIGGAMGGLNGLYSGVHGIYNWGSPSGYFAFLADSTWGLLGTSLGNISQTINIISGAKYRDDLSRRQNRSVYEGGIYLARDDAFTEGNVISNAAAGSGQVDLGLINNHESLHILQNRIFGPVFQGVYIVWAVGGLAVGSVYKIFNWDHSWGDLVETAVYYDNPFEYWAYNNQNYWQPTGQKGFDPIIAWG